LALVGGLLLLTAAQGGLPGVAHANKGECSQPFSGGGNPSASDCLSILATAVGNSNCEGLNPCVCAPKGTLPARASDALICLNKSVGAPATLACPCADLRDSAYAFTPASDVPNVNVQSCFTATDYIGAFPQGESPDTGDWTLGWTIDVHGNNTVWAPVGTPTATGTCPTGTALVTPGPTSTSLPAPFAGQMDICELQANYTTDGQTITLTNDNIYVVNNDGSQGTKVGDGDAIGSTAGTVVNVTLEIEEGTLILGDGDEALAITRGSQIIANGTAANPIVMGSRTWFNDWVGGGDGTCDDQEWGGLVVTGFGVENEAGEPVAEGFLVPFYWGGTDNNDDSGSLEYTLVRCGGFELGAANELNGITIFGVGRQTEMNHLQVHKNFDDGIEWFGGENCVTQAVVTDVGDDSFDTDRGYSGALQFGLAIQDPVDNRGNRGFEMDSGTGLPASAPNFANVTIVNNPNALGNDASPSQGINVGSGMDGYFFNIVQYNARDTGIDLENDILAAKAGVLGNPTDGTLRMLNMIVHNPNTGDPEPGPAGTDINNVEVSSGTVDTDAQAVTFFDADPDNRRGVDPTISATGYPGSPVNP
jgi:hypothetical protein